MKTRALRISSYKDYIAVDVIDSQSQILSTPLYLNIGESEKVKWHDEYEDIWLDTTISISDDFTVLNCVDSEGFMWQSPFDELIDKDVCIFLK